ncbi:hypothetical protein BDP27DRAFT_1444170 [Rhodocollybia butyracea]|uniref:C2H2-type domain-containing protein n=1 Tax=Rhodocollybia butyracea TaxID=206335 RepID=A0A9P5UCM5_9AGAR|nr:hypothetical protein BDP27DRAFT_1444170 [Rhodocollybia butyracea]
MALSGLRTSSKRSNAEILKERLNENENLRALHDQDLDTFHYRQIAAPTQQHHNNVKRHYKDYAEEEKAKGREAHSEVVIGSQIPPLKYIKGFALYLASALQGKSSAYIRLKSLKSYMTTFLALWPRYAGSVVPKELRNQIWAFVSSEDLLKVVPLSTGRRAMKSIEPRCLQIICETVYSSRGIFRTNRMRSQLAFLILFSTASASRPGAVVESKCYVDSNEALKWGNFTFHVIPNSDDPYHPWLLVQIRSTLIKGHRTNDAIFQDLLFHPDLNKNDRLTCAILPLMHLAFEDNIFKNVQCIEEIMSPGIPPKNMFKLQLRDEVKEQVVLRAEVKTLDGFKISNLKALKYDRYMHLLRKLSIAAGFQEPLTPYDMRGSQGNKADAALGQNMCKMLMTHDPKSVDKYCSRTLTTDLSAIANRRDQEENVTAYMRSATSISARLDQHAPKKLSLQQRHDLLSEPLLVQLRREKAEELEKITELQLQLASADEPLQSQIETAIASHRKDSATLAKKHELIYVRESRFRIKEFRQEFFKDADVRELSGQSSVNTPSLLTLRQKEDPALTAGFMELLQNLSSEIPSDDFSVLVNSLLSQPEQVLSLEYYPGERPTDDNNCPVCEKSLAAANLRAGVRPGSHIHKCIGEREAKIASERLAEMFTPRSCAYGGCSHATRQTVFSTRSEYLTHINIHINALQVLSSKPLALAVCRMKEHRNTCNEEEADDWPTHFAECHAINVLQTVETCYCVMCAIWISDDIGDGQVHEVHHTLHYEALFEAYSLRSKEDKAMLPIGVTEIDGYIEYEHGSGFNGKHPEFHGYLVSGVALAPAFCPFCIFDEFLPMQRRMTQYVETRIFVKHLGTHTSNLEDTENFCPVPSCGEHTFTKFDLITHLISSHRVPAAGSAKHVNVRRLRLLASSSVPTKRASDAADNIMDDEEPDVRPKKTKTSKKSRSHEDGYYCYGCRDYVKDIDAHLSRPARSEKAKKCRTIHEYAKMTDSDRGPKVNWVSPT